jgi:hypothetical protein
MERENFKFPPLAKIISKMKRKIRGSSPLSLSKLKRDTYQPLQGCIKCPTTSVMDFSNYL